MANIHFKIVTPERTVADQEVYQVTLPIQDGEVTVLPEHIPYIGLVRAGEIVLRTEPGGPETSFATSGGFVEFHKNVLVVLADTAERAEEIDLERAEAARTRALELQKERIHMDDEEYARTAALLEKELARIKVARKRHGRTGIHLNGNNQP